MRLLVDFLCRCGWGLAAALAVTPAARLWLGERGYDPKADLNADGAIGEEAAPPKRWIFVLAAGRAARASTSMILCG
jgi:hypothetical protein